MEQVTAKGVGVVEIYNQVNFCIARSFNSENGHKPSDVAVKRIFADLFTDIGFLVTASSKSDVFLLMTRGKEELQYFVLNETLSGIIAQESIEEIEDVLLSEQSQVNLYDVNITQEYVDESAAWLNNQLYLHHGCDLRCELIEHFKTARKTLSKKLPLNWYQNSPIKTLSKKETATTYGNFVQDTIQSLVEEGLLIESVENDGFYRTLNRKECKEWAEAPGNTNGELELHDVGLYTF